MTCAVATLFSAVLIAQAQQPSQSSVVKDGGSIEDRLAKVEDRLSAITTILQGLSDSTSRTEANPQLVGSKLSLSDAPTRGAEAALVSVVEVADYHCPFCRRTARDVLPRLLQEYVASGKVRYTFVDYPLEQLHPDSLKSHHAASCPGSLGKYWEMHDQLFANAPAHGDRELSAAAAAIGLDSDAFRKCMSSPEYDQRFEAAVAGVRALGIAGTPTLLIGMSPRDGAPFVVRRYITGAQPFAVIKLAIEVSLLEATSSSTESTHR